MDLGIDISAFLRELKPEVAQQLFQSLSSKKLPQLQGYYSDLQSLVAEIKSVYLKLDNRHKFAAGGDQAAFEHLIDNQSIMYQLSTQVEQASMKSSIESLTQRLFFLEHNILGALAPDSETLDYAVFLTTGDGNQSTIIRSIVSQADLEAWGQLSGNESRLVKTTRGGQMVNLRFTKGIVKQIGVQDENFNLQNYKDQIGMLSQDALNRMKERAEQLQRLLEKLNQLEEIRHKQKLGQERENQVQQLRKLFQTHLETRAIDLGTLFTTPNIDNMIMDFYKGTGPMPKIKSTQLSKKGNTYNIALSYNRGHIMESLERVIQATSQDPNAASTMEELHGIFGQSLGKAIWWAQGDVNQTQVKSMLGRNQQVDIASLQSVYNLANGLLDTLRVSIEDQSQIKEYIDQYLEADIAKAKIAQGNKQIIDYLERTADELLAELG